MALALGVGVDYVTIIPSEPFQMGAVEARSLGRVQYATLPIKGRDDIARRLAMDLAGPLAEWRSDRYPRRRTLGGRARAELHRNLCAHLEYYANKPVEEVPGDYVLAREFYREQGWFYGIFTPIVRGLDVIWHQIRRLALALEVHRTLNGAIAARVVERSTPPPSLAGTAEQLHIWSIIA